MRIEGLRTPGNGSQITPGPVLFSWDPDPNADQYILFVGTDRELTTDPGAWPYVNDLPGTIRLDNGNKTSVQLTIAPVVRYYWRVDNFVRSIGRLGSSATWSFDVEQAARGTPPGVTPYPGDEDARTIMYVSGAVAFLGILWAVNSARKNTR